MHAMIRRLIEDLSNLDRISQKLMDKEYDNNISDSLAVDEIIYSIRDRIIENIIVDNPSCRDYEEAYSREELNRDLVSVTQPYTCNSMHTISADEFMEKWGDRIKWASPIG